MWEYQTSKETTAPAAAVWRVMADLEKWPAWNGDIAEISIDGPFARGSRIAMTLRSGDAITLELADVREDEGFTDEASFEGLMVRTIHRIENAGPVRRVSYRTEISGDAPKQVLRTVGAGITADFAEVVGALVERAEHGGL
jgi:hypothetical protein